MKSYLFFVLLLVAGCNSSEQSNNIEKQTDSLITTDKAIEKNTDTSVSGDQQIKDSVTVNAPGRYSNERFKNVTVKKTGDGEFVVQGQAQIFEANFSWVVEDGHEELKQGYTTTDAGAPAWGNFSFTVTATKERPNSTLHLVLFELSAKDGSRQYELPVLLP